MGRASFALSGYIAYLYDNQIITSIGSVVKEQIASTKLKSPDKLVREIVVICE